MFDFVVYHAFFVNYFVHKLADFVVWTLLAVEEKAKITKILSSGGTSKRKGPNQMTKSNDKTHQTHGQLSDSFSNVEIGGLNLVL